MQNLNKKQTQTKKQRQTKSDSRRGQERLTERTYVPKPGTELNIGTNKITQSTIC